MTMPNPILAAGTLALLAFTASTRSTDFASVQDSGGPGQDEPWTVEELEASSDRILTQIEAMRGMRFKHDVKVDVADSETFQVYTQALSDELIPPELQEAQELFSRLIGLFPVDLDIQAMTEEMLAKMVAGFYDPLTSTFYLVEQFPRGAEGVILAHELTHALDDQYFDLLGSWAPMMVNSDRAMAFRAVIEGSGTNLMSAWMRRYPQEMDLQVLMRYQQQSTVGLDDVPSSLWKPLIWAYNSGAAFLTRTDSVLQGQMEEASADDVVRAFREPPTSTEQVLHPEKYWSSEHRDPPTEVAFDAGKLPSGWSLVMDDTIGELGLGLILAPDSDKDLGIDQAMSAEYTYPATAGWDGDRVALFRDEDGALAWRLFTVWDSERDAAEFLGAMSQKLALFEETSRALVPEDLAKRRSSVDATVAYGEGEHEVIVEVRAGCSRSKARRVFAAATWTRAE